MKSLKRILSALRSFLGWGDPSEDRLSPPHGWLLPTPSDVLAKRAHGESPSVEPLTGRPPTRGPRLLV
jgi:hypothetical protein